MGHIVFGIFGLLSFLFIALSLSLWIIPVVVFALIKLAVPITVIKSMAYGVMG